MSSPVPIGALLRERYAIERELGRGGFGVVYLARDLQLHAKPVVIKCLILGSNQLVEWMTRKFDEEINALAAIDHPGVVRILDAGKTDGGVPYLVMDYIEGVTLRAVLRAGVPDLKRLAGWIRQIASALTAAHANRIIHRDLKPENIMIQTLANGEEHVRLIDFGIASFKDATRAATTGETMVAGTEQYMAPEQFRGQPSTASDVFALGVITYEAVTSRLPTGTPMVDPRSIRPELPEAAAEVILEALRIPANERPSAQEFGERFYQAVEERASPSAKPSQERALDVAMAKEIPVHEPAELIALIRQTHSEGLKGILESDPDFSVSPEDVRSKPMVLEFPLDAHGRPSPLDLTLRIDSPDFTPASQNKLIRVPPFADSEPYTFLLTPMQLGELRINVELYAGEVAVFSRMVRTRARVSDRMPVEVSKTIVTIPLTVLVSGSSLVVMPGGGAELQMPAPVAAAPAAPARAAQVEAALEEATRLMERGQVEGATRALERATSIGSGVPQALVPPARAKNRTRWMTQAAVAALVGAVAIGTTTSLFVHKENREFEVVQPSLPAAEPPAVRQPEPEPPRPREPARHVERPLVSSPKPAPPPVQAAPLPAPTSPAQSAPAPPAPADLEKLRQRQASLAARMQSVNAILERLIDQQTKAGLGVNAELTASARRVQVILDQATVQLREGRPADAKKGLDSAQTELENLEARLGR